MQRTLLLSSLLCGAQCHIREIYFWSAHSAQHSAQGPYPHILYIGLCLFTLCYFMVSTAHQGTPFSSSSDLSRIRDWPECMRPVAVLVLGPQSSALPQPMHIYPSCLLLLMLLLGDGTTTLLVLNVRCAAAQSRLNAMIDMCAMIASRYSLWRTADTETPFLNRSVTVTVHLYGTIYRAIILGTAGRQRRGVHHPRASFSELRNEELHDALAPNTISRSCCAMWDFSLRSSRQAFRRNIEQQQELLP